MALRGVHKKTEIVDNPVTIYHPEKNSSGLLRADFDTFLDTPHFLGYIRKGWANFHIDI